MILSGNSVPVRSRSREYATTGEVSRVLASGESANRTQRTKRPEWVFVAGFLLGSIGIVTYRPSDPVSSLRQSSIVVAAGPASLGANPAVGSDSYGLLRLFSGPLSTIGPFVRYNAAWASRRRYLIAIIRIEGSATQATVLGLLSCGAAEAETRSTDRTDRERDRAFGLLVERGHPEAELEAPARANPGPR
jgi:hypothetical protein